MATAINEPVYRILVAQAKNIARINSLLEIPGTDGSGDQIRLWGPQPNIIRLYDTPIRMFEDAALQNWERIVTLMPLIDEPAGRAINRSDRNVRYQVQFMVRLTESELQADRIQTTTDAMRPDNILARKAHKLIYDWHHIFHDNDTLPDAECPQGLVDHTDYTMTWTPGVEYPATLFSAEVFSQRSAW